MTVKNERVAVPDGYICLGGGFELTFTRTETFNPCVRGRHIHMCKTRPERVRSANARGTCQPPRPKRGFRRVLGESFGIEEDRHL